MKRLATICALPLFLSPYSSMAETVRAYSVEQTSAATINYESDPTQTSKTEIEPLDKFIERSRSIMEKAVKEGQRSKTTIERGEKEPPLEVSFPLKVQGYDLNVPKGDIVNGKPEYLATVRDESGAVVVGEISEKIETLDSEGKKGCVQFADSVEGGTQNPANQSAAYDPITSYVTVAVDVSSSMTDSLPKVKTELASFLSSLPQDNTICRVIAFSHEFNPVHTGNGQRCDSIDISGLQAYGGTDIYKALNAEYAYYATLPDNALHSVVLMTDGYDNSGDLTGDRKKVFLEAKGETKSFTYYEGAQERNTQLDAVSDAVLERSKIAFSFMQFLDVMGSNVSGQRRLVEVDCGDT